MPARTIATMINGRQQIMVAPASRETALAPRSGAPAEMRTLPLPRLSLADLPPANTTRWVTRRKAAVVAAVREGVLTLEDACKRYHLSVEEFNSWQRLVERHGLAGLRATRVQDYRAGEGEQRV
jgi:Protein of unknown function (DUF1153)